MNTIIKLRKIGKSQLNKNKNQNETGQISNKKNDKGHVTHVRVCRLKKSATDSRGYPRINYRLI